MSNLPLGPVNSVERATCVCARGVTHTFEIDPIGTIYKNRPGVYAFVRRLPDGSWDVIYIGETESFYSRLSQGLTAHHQWESIARAGATHIATMHVPGGLRIRERIETDLRHAIPTPCNRQ
jgi:hypothetical protein